MTNSLEERERERERERTLNGEGGSVVERGRRVAMDDLWWDVPACSVCQRIAVVDMDHLRAFPAVFLVVTNQNKPCQQLKREREQFLLNLSLKPYIHSTRSPEGPKPSNLQDKNARHFPIGSIWEDRPS
jgi:hypothetical protein